MRGTRTEGHADGAGERSDGGRHARDFRQVDRKQMVSNFVMGNSVCGYHLIACSGYTIKISIHTFILVGMYRYIHTYIHTTYIHIYKFTYQ